MPIPKKTALAYGLHFRSSSEIDLLPADTRGASSDPVVEDDGNLAETDVGPAGSPPQEETQPDATMPAKPRQKAAAKIVALVLEHEIVYKRLLTDLPLEGLQRHSAPSRKTTSRCVTVSEPKGQSGLDPEIKAVHKAAIRPGKAVSPRTATEKFRPGIEKMALDLSIQHSVDRKDLEQEAYLAILQLEAQGQTFSVMHYARYAMLSFIQNEGLESRRPDIPTITRQPSLEDKLVSRLLRECLSDLDTELQIAIEMIYIEGLNRNQVAKELNVSTSTIKYREAKALRLVRERLAAKRIFRTTDIAPF